MADPVQIQITAANVNTCDRTAVRLKAALEELAAMTARYPVEVTFAGYRFVFRSRQEIEALISELETKVAEYRRVA